MTRSLPAFTRIHEMPTAPAGWYDYARVVLCDGSIALIRVNRDFRGLGPVDVWQAWRDAELLISRLGVNEAIRVKAEPFPLVDRLADGGWLVVGGRANAEEHNACIYEPDGSKRTSFHAGDAIMNMAVSADGSIWLGYFDEGVFGGDSLSQYGLVCLAPDGQPIWLYDNSECAIADCYALSTSGPVAWACPYTDFPILRVSTGDVRQWKNPIAGSHAICAGEGYVILAGGYRGDREKVTLLHLKDQEAEPIAQFKLSNIGEEMVTFQGRNQTMFAFLDQTVIEVEISEWVKALTPARRGPFL